MPTKPHPVTHGTINGTPIVSEVDVDGLSSKLYVTLSASYVRVVPLGYPDPNAGAEAAKNVTRTGNTHNSGTRLLLFKHEALAIVAAGGGALS